MRYNLSNGGLVTILNNKIYITDIKKFTGTYIIGSGHQKQLDGLFWFMNCDDSYIYYSDQKRENYLLRFNICTESTEVIVESPCYGVIFIDGCCYYINERDKKLYRYSLSERKGEVIADNNVLCFFAGGDTIFYSTDRGIYCCTLKGEMREEISDVPGVGLIALDEKIFFADKENNYILTMLDINTGEREIFEEISPISINTDGNYLYCSNRKHPNSIYRIDFRRKTCIRICGESSDYLHIIDDELYFCSNLGWYKMPLSGGQPQKII